MRIRDFHFFVKIPRECERLWRSSGMRMGIAAHEWEVMGIKNPFCRLHTSML